MAVRAFCVIWASFPWMKAAQAGKDRCREQLERVGSIRASMPGSWLPSPRMVLKAICFERIRRPPQDTGYMPPAHGCPPFLIGRAFSVILSLKGDHKEVTGSKGMTSGLSMSAVLAGRIPGEARLSSQMR